MAVVVTHAAVAPLAGGAKISSAEWNEGHTVPVATQAQAEAGTDNETLMTPLRSAEAIAALGGKVLQVVHSTATTTASVTGATWTDTTLSASITPRSTASKILILVSQQLSVSRAGTSAYGSLRLLRGATSITEVSSFDYGVFISGSGATSTEVLSRAALNVIDSPSTASSVTYKTQIRGDSAGHSVEVQSEASVGLITLMEIAG